MEKLPRCPYCGGPVVMHSNAKRYYAVCKHCSMLGPEADTEERARELFCDMKAEVDSEKCPFCGGVKWGIKFDGYASFMADCPTCKAQGPLWMEPIDAATLFKNRYKVTKASTLAEIEDYLKVGEM